MPTNTSGLSPYMDTGTGAYDGPPTEVTYSIEHDLDPIGAHPGPEAETTTESPPEHLSEPTGASPNPPAAVTYHQHPAAPPEATETTKTKAVKAEDVEDKAVKVATTSTKRGR